MLLVSLSLIAAACGDDDDDTAAPEEDNASTTAPEGEEASSLSGDPIKIGALMTLSGPAASTGQLLRTAIDFWMSLHADEGIDGRPIELVIKDDGGTAADAADAARDLIDREQVDIVVGPILSDPSSSALPLLTDAGITSVILSAFQPARDPAEFPYTYPLEIGNNHNAVSFVRALGEAEVDSVGYIGANNTLGNALFGVMEGAAEEQGVQVVGSQFYEPGATDVTTQVQNLRSAGAEAIVIGDIVQPVIVTILDAIATLGWDDVRIISLSPLSDYPVVSQADPDVLSRGIATGHTERTLNPLPDDVAEVRDQFAEFLGQDDIERRLYQSLRPYEAMELIKYMVESTGGTDSDAIKEFIEGEGGWDGLSAYYTFTPTEHPGITEDVSAIPGTYDNGAYDPVG